MRFCAWVALCRPEGTFLAAEAVLRSGIQVVSSCSEKRGLCSSTLIPRSSQLACRQRKRGNSRLRGALDIQVKLLMSMRSSPWLREALGTREKALNYAGPGIT